MCLLLSILDFLKAKPKSAERIKSKIWDRLITKFRNSNPSPKPLWTRKSSTPKYSNMNKKKHVSWENKRVSLNRSSNSRSRYGKHNFWFIMTYPSFGYIEIKANLSLYLKVNFNFKVISDYEYNILNIFQKFVFCQT